MKTPNVNKPTEESQSSSLESLHSFNSDSEREELHGTRRNKRNLSKVAELEDRLAVSEKKKIRLYEVIIRDKDNLIKAITETKDLSIKINDLQNAINFKNSSNFNNAQEGSTNFVSNSSKLSHWNSENFTRIQKEIMENQIESQTKQIAELKLNLQERDATIAEFKSKIEEKEKLEENFKKEKGCLRAKIAQLELKAKIISTKPNEKDKQVKEASSALNLTENPKVRMVVGLKFGPSKTVFEDIPSAGSDWIVIQRRLNGQLNFNQYSPVAYDNGFGDLSKEFWMGFEFIHQLTNTQTHELYVQLVDFNNQTIFARYDNFVVGSKDEKYVLKSLGSYSGNAGDAFRSLEKNAVVGIPSLQELHTCLYWWHSNQIQLYNNLNAEYSLLPRSGLGWGNWKDLKRLKSCKMLIRPKTN
ncbi:fibroleukin-like isoform X2 [Drosophila takahashii]|uniref:fibroleukin-like isoform X2 n=1 Tax=Drosophila takahashii TaxID=29030 RepID=UPI00389954A3